MLIFKNMTRIKMYTYNVQIVKKKYPLSPLLLTFILYCVFIKQT